MRMSEEQWDDVIRVNLKSVFNLTKAVIKPMMKAKSGSIINLTSIVGIKGNAGQANYSASKAGIIGFTKSIALELGSRNIRCNSISPARVHTPFVDGFIATAALLVAIKSNQTITDHCVFAHCSDENGHRKMLEHLNAKPILQLGMRLGEGTGAALAIPLLQSAVQFLNEMASFESAGVSGKE